MERYELPLTTKLGHNLHYNQDKILTMAEDLESFIEGQETINTEDFAKTVMFSHEIKSNNDIEGYNDDVKTIKEVIDAKESETNIPRNQRIINLYRGYQYILTHKTIDENSLKELYAILSKDILEQKDKSRMGEFYRTAPVYILKNGRLDVEPYEGVPAEDISEYMNKYFSFLSSDALNKSKTEEYIKSQILHYYFVYIHPYFDVNGRTSRTVSMWQLLNKQAYPYIIFNRGISFTESDYEKKIIITRGSNNLTYFLEYMLATVKSELEKEILMQHLAANAKEKLTGLEYQTLLQLLNMKGNITIADFAVMYNRMNPKKKTKEIFETMLQPLIDKQVLQVERETSKGLYGSVKNKVLSIKHPNDIPNNFK